MKLVWRAEHAERPQSPLNQAEAYLMLDVDGARRRDRFRLRRFDTKAEAEETLTKAQGRGQRAVIQPLAAWAGKY